MVKLVVSDSAVLSVVGVGTAVHALHWSLDAKGAHDWHFDKVRACCRGEQGLHGPGLPPLLEHTRPGLLCACLQSVPYDATTARSYAFALGGMAAQTVSVGLSENSKVGGHRR